MNIAIVGATGGIGQHLVRSGLARDLTLTALTRRPPTIEHPQLRWVQGDAATGQGFDQLVDGADVVLSALGSSRFAKPVTSVGTGHLIKAMQDANVKRLLATSSLGIGDSNAQGWATSKLFMGLVVPLVLRQQFWDLQTMEALITASDLDHCIIRPVGLTNRANGPAKAYGSDARKLPSFVSRLSVANWMLDWAQGNVQASGPVTLALGPTP